MRQFLSQEGKLIYLTKRSIQTVCAGICYGIYVLEECKYLHNARILKFMLS